MLSVSQSGPPADDPPTPPAQQPGQGWGPPPPGPAQGPPPGSGWGAPPGQPGSPPPPPSWGAPPASPYGAPYGWGGPPPAPKPGSIPLRPLGVGDILEATFSILRRYPAATFGSAAIVVGIVSLAQLALLWPTFSVLADLPDPTDGDAAAAWFDSFAGLPWVSILVGGALVALLSFALFTSLTGLLSVVVGQAALGRPLSFGQAWSKSGPRLLRLIVTVILVAVIVAGVWVLFSLISVVMTIVDPPTAVGVLLLLVGIAVGIAASVWLGVRLALATPAVMLESDAGGPIGALTAIRRSWSLVSGGWWRTFGIVLLAAVIAGALAQVIAIPINLVVGAAPLDLGAALVASTLAGALGQAVTVPISGIVLGLVYVDRRMRTEGLDRALARAADVEPPAQSPS